MSTKLAGTFVGAAIALMASAAFAQGIYTLTVSDGDNAGRAYPGENEYRFNNDQEGAGMEHVRCNLIPNAPGGARVMCVGTGSYTDIPGSPVNDRIQVLSERAVGPKERCLLVRVGDTDILVGVASGSVNTLHVFPPGSNTEAPPAPVSGKPALPNFKDMLLRSLGK